MLNRKSSVAQNGRWTKAKEIGDGGQQWEEGNGGPKMEDGK